MTGLATNETNKLRVLPDCMGSTPDFRLTRLVRLQVGLNGLSNFPTPAVRERQLPKPASGSTRLRAAIQQVQCELPVFGLCGR